MKGAIVIHIPPAIGTLCRRSSSTHSFCSRPRNLKQAECKNKSDIAGARRSCPSYLAECTTAAKIQVNLLTSWRCDLIVGCLSVKLSRLSATSGQESQIKRGKSNQNSTWEWVGSCKSTACVWNAQTLERCCRYRWWHVTRWGRTSHTCGSSRRFTTASSSASGCSPRSSTGNGPVTRHPSLLACRREPAVRCSKTSLPICRITRRRAKFPNLTGECRFSHNPLGWFYHFQGAIHYPFVWFGLIKFELLRFISNLDDWNCYTGSGRGWAIPRILSELVGTFSRKVLVFLTVSANWD